MKRMKNGMKFKGLGQMLVWAARWRFDKKWREATRRRYLRDQGMAQAAGKPLRDTALRKFVAGRLAPKKLGYLDRTYPS